MVFLRKMLKEEFQAYCEYFIADYGREIEENYGHATDASVELARKDLHQHFPNGLESDTHSLLCIETEIKAQLTVVGYLWHLVHVEDKATFIFDLYMVDEYRGQGLGRQAISLLESQLRVEGIKQVKPSVAFNSQRAVKFFEEIGFSITGFKLSKILPNQRGARV